MPLSGALSFTLIACVLISGLWGSLPVLGAFAYVGLAVGLLVASRIPGELSFRRPLASIGLKQAAIGIISCLPIAAFLFLTWNQEFPFVGDHDFHLAQASSSYLFWRVRFPIVAPLLIFLGMAYRRRLMWVGIFGFVAIVAGSLTRHGGMDFSIRYPGAFHFPLFPLNGVARLFHWPSPLNANRLTNALALPCWIFILRPRLLGKQPDARCLAVAFLFFFQKDVVYYFSSAYLEPWALIFCALAVESALEGDQWMPLLCVSLGSMFKEQTILLLPFFAVLSWLQVPRGSLARQVQWAGVCALTAMPFSFYYSLRRHSGVWRTAGLAAPSAIFDPERAGRFLGRVAEQLGPAFPLLILCLGLALVASLVPSSRRRVWACLTAAAFFQVLFFYCDRISIPWTGYPRFHLVAGVVLAFVVVDILSRAPRVGAAVVSLGLVLNLLAWEPLANSVVAHADWRRNFIEHVDSPVSFPIRRAITEARRGGLFAGLRRIRVLNPDFEPFAGSYRISAIQAAYPRLFDGLDVQLDLEPKCRCLSGEEAVLAPMIFFPGPHPARGLIEERQSGCLAELRASCGKVVVQSDEGQPLIALGLPSPSSR